MITTKTTTTKNLSDCGIEVVHDHEHDGGGLRRFGGIFVDVVGFHRERRRPEPVHVNVTVELQLFREFLRQSAEGKTSYDARK